jgi:hypothetical protein
MEKMTEAIRRCSSPGYDQFDRKYPVKLTLKNGKVVYGHFSSRIDYSNETTNIHFVLIEDIEAWKRNEPLELNDRRIVYFENTDEIEAIANVKNY